MRAADEFAEYFAARTRHQHARGRIVLGRAIAVGAPATLAGILIPGLLHRHGVGSGSEVLIVAVVELAFAAVLAVWLSRSRCDVRADHGALIVTNPGSTAVAPVGEMVAIRLGHQPFGWAHWLEPVIEIECSDRRTIRVAASVGHPALRSDRDAQAFVKELNSELSDVIGKSR